MQLTTNTVRVLMLLLTMSADGFASGYMGDLADAWSRASIVVLGRPRLVQTATDRPEPERAIYAVEVQQAYKGVKPDGTIGFIDAHYATSAGLNIQEGETYLLFLQTGAERAKEGIHEKNSLGGGVSGLRAYRVAERNRSEIEAGIATVKAYEILAAADRKGFLLQHLAIPNVYTDSFIEREIFHHGIKEALPHFQQQLAQATTETDKLRLVSALWCLGDPGVKLTLLAWLDDDSFQKKREIIEELVLMKDPSVIPSLRKYVDAQDDFLAESARSGLLRLGDPDGKRLLFEMLQKSSNPVARYNAIHHLNWDYAGDFTAEERENILGLVHDKDENVARVAGLIVEKWKPVSDKPPKAPVPGAGSDGWRLHGEMK